MTKSRNPYAIPAKARKAGKIKSAKDKRRNNKNKQRELLKETVDMEKDGN